MIDKIKKIDFLKKVVSVEEIHKGLSNAKLYKVIKDGKEYLLKFKFAYLKSAFVYIVAFYLKNEEFFKANQQLEDINNVLKDQNK